MSERKRDKRCVGKDPTVAIRWKDSHLKTGTFPNRTERFQFIDFCREICLVFVKSVVNLYLCFVCTLVSDRVSLLTGDWEFSVLRSLSESAAGVDEGLRVE